jgi:hypothetical protein
VFCDLERGRGGGWRRVAERRGVLESFYVRCGSVREATGAVRAAHLLSLTKYDFS